MRKKSTNIHTSTTPPEKRLHCGLGGGERRLGVPRSLDRDLERFLELIWRSAGGANENENDFDLNGWATREKAEKMEAGIFFSQFIVLAGNANAANFLQRFSSLL